MKVIVKYKIIDRDNLHYAMFEENGEVIPNKRITDRIVPLGGVASNLGWLRKDVHRCTDEIKEHFEFGGEVEYVLMEYHDYIY